MEALDDNMLILRLYCDDGVNDVCVAFLNEHDHHNVASSSSSSADLSRESACATLFFK